MVMYSDVRILSSLASSRVALTDHLSLVDERVRIRMYSRMKLSGYRTERPIFTKRGPSPVSLDLASQERLTRSRSAAPFGISKRSSACPGSVTSVSIVQFDGRH